MQALVKASSQVLTGEIPFRRVRHTELGYRVYEGLRPIKPENSSDIGFSDFLWKFAQRCWDKNGESRPKVTELVAHLERAAAHREGPMPPSGQGEDIPSASAEPQSDTMLYGEFVFCPCLMPHLASIQVQSSRLPRTLRELPPPNLPPPPILMIPWKIFAEARTLTRTTSRLQHNFHHRSARVLGPS